MTKNKKQISDIEVIESYFTTDSEHLNKTYFKIYKEAEQEGIFDDLNTPLWLINKLSSDCYAGRNKPIQTFNNIKKVLKDEHLNYEQQCFIYDHLIKFLEDSTWTDESGKDVELTQIKDLLEDEFMSLKPEGKNKYETIPPESSFNFDDTKKHLNTLQTAKEKIKYLIERETDYEQNKGLEWDIGTSYGERCKLERKKIEAFAQLEKNAGANSTEIKTPASNFKLKETILSKADYIRIINSLSEIKAFEKDVNGIVPNKKDVMIAFGNLVGLDLSSYHTDLNKALEKSEEKNFEIFDKLKEKTMKIWNEKDQNIKK